MDNEKISICAYFISKFDMRAVRHLGYQTRIEAMDNISKLFGTDNYNYLKRRRDEFDALTGSHRRGGANRPPRPSVKKMHEDLNPLTFEQLARRVKGIIDDIMIGSDNELECNIYEVFNHSAPEGRKKEIYTTKYERNITNRHECIRFHGTACKSCGFDFLKVYGLWGEGFIEVHHIKPLYCLNEEIVVNPQTDLVPVCSNCHRMIHRKKNQILTVEELKIKMQEG